MRSPAGGSVPLRTRGSEVGEPAAQSGRSWCPRPLYRLPRHHLIHPLLRCSVPGSTQSWEAVLTPVAPSWKRWCGVQFSGQEFRRGYHFLLQGIFPTQGSNPGFLHCRWILYACDESCKRLSYQESPVSWKQDSLLWFCPSFLSQSLSFPGGKQK